MAWIESLGSCYKAQFMVRVTVEVTAHNSDEAENVAYMVLDEAVAEFPDDVEADSYELMSLEETDSDAIMIHGENEEDLE